MNKNNLNETETIKMSEVHAVMVENLILKEQLLKYEKDKIAGTIAKELNITPDKIVNMNPQARTIVILKTKESAG